MSASVLGPSPNGADDELRIEMLGAGQEVGRSCCVLTYKGEWGEVRECDASLDGFMCVGVQGRKGQ